MPKKNNILELLVNFLSHFRKENVIEFLKNIAFYILLFIFTYMNVTFYTKSIHFFSEQIVVGLTMASLEIIAVWLLFRTREIEISREKWYNIGKIILLVLLYFGLSIPSIASRVAYTIEAVKEQSTIIESGNSGIDDYKYNIGILKEDIQDKREQRENLYNTSTNTNYIVYQRKILMKQILSNQNVIKDLEKEIKEIGGKKIVAIEDSYSIMGKPFKLTGISVFTILLIIRLFSLDICIILIIFLGKDKNKKKSNVIDGIEKDSSIYKFVKEHKTSLLKYIDALMEDENNKEKLKVDLDIAAITGLPYKLCKKYRKLLKTEITYGKIPVIYSIQGATKANFFKKQAKEIIYTYCLL